MPSVDDLTAVRVRVPGKVNLHLAVGAARPDGFHDLVTVFQAVDLQDEVVARPARGLELVIRGEGADQIPTGPGNLAWQAASLLAEHAQVAPHVRLELTKAIPVAAGMAGGSADAAGTLLACSELWHLGLSRDELCALAPRLGSDVAFGLVGGNALGTGRGEILAPVLATGTFHWVLALAHGGISAADAYRRLDARRGSHTAAVDAGGAAAVLDALRSGDPDRLSTVLYNDLQEAALLLSPRLRRTLDAGSELGALAGIVSGSGPTCAFLTDSKDSALRLARALGAEGVCRTTLVVSGPVPGARTMR